MLASPWGQLPTEPPYILPEDRPAVEVFNRDLRKKQDPKIRTELLPEPFIGRADSSVVLLALNPGYSKDDLKAQRQPGFAERLRNCITGNGGDGSFYHLALPGPGQRWWRRALKPLLGECDEAAVANELLCLEYFPYHSDRFGHALLRLPSQTYTFELLRRAIARGAPIILLRGYAAWTGAVPELAGYGQLYRTQSQRVASISPGNCASGSRRQ